LVYHFNQFNRKIEIYSIEKVKMTSTEQTIRPFNLTRKACQSCGEGCDKPGLAHPQHNPYDNSCGDCAMICAPLTLVIDLIMLPLLPFRLLHQRYRQARKTGTDENQDSG